MLCKICGKSETDRVIHGVPICDECYVEGRYDLPETHIKLIEMSGRPMPVKPSKPAPKPKVAKPKPTVTKPPATAEGTTPPSPESAAKEPTAKDSGFGDYLCPKCKVTHRVGSKVHKRHLKLL